MKMAGKLLGILLKMVAIVVGVFPLLMLVIPPNPPGEMASVFGLIFSIPIGILVYRTGSMILDFTEKGRIQLVGKPGYILNVILVVLLIFWISRF